jgi:hypothetical protein
VRNVVVPIADLPPELDQRYIGRTGQYRLFVFPTENIWEFEPVARFVTDLQSVDPDALGTLVKHFAYLSTIIEGYQKAGLYAYVGVAISAFLAFRAVLRNMWPWFRSPLERCGRWGSWRCRGRH